MVRCEEFYKRFEKKGNFCNKSDATVKNVENYINYIKRHRLHEYGGYKISNGALDPMMSVEHIKSGRVHALALRNLKTMIRREDVFPERVTRRLTVELINKANLMVGEQFRLDHIPGVRVRMGEFEHEISEIGYDMKNMFDSFKSDIGAKNNNETMQIMLECCVRNIDDVRKIKAEYDSKQETENNVEIVATQ